MCKGFRNHFYNCVRISASRFFCFELYICVWWNGCGKYLHVLQCNSHAFHAVCFSMFAMQGDTYSSFPHNFLCCSAYGSTPPRGRLDVCLYVLYDKDKKVWASARKSVRHACLRSLPWRTACESSMRQCTWKCTPFSHVFDTIAIFLCPFPCYSTCFSMYSISYVLLLRCTWKYAIPISLFYDSSTIFLCAFPCCSARFSTFLTCLSMLHCT
jgi:hypothetical protein